MEWTRRAFFLVVFMALCSCGSVDPLASGHESHSQAGVTIGGKRIPVELAITPEQQRRGLGERDRLEWGHGMLFLHNDTKKRRYWMKGMRFDIDIIWIRDGRISEIAHAVPHVPGENGPTVQSSEAVNQVLEVPAGYSMIQGWRRGQRVQLDGINPIPVVPSPDD